MGVTCLVRLIFRFLKEFDERFESSVHPDQIATLLLFRQPIDGTGTQHLQLGTFRTLQWITIIQSCNFDIVVSPGK